ncbi:MAG: hypothetical protein RLZZ511_1400 [Cyanobacteriota bacterium]|jgi:HPt (histidine-containing phosphotransfer) domain-containing protein
MVYGVLMRSIEMMDYATNRNAVTQPTDPNIDATPRESPIDWQQLRQLSEGNEEFELELLRIFTRETWLLLPQAHQAIGLRHAQPLAQIAHKIKGSSGNIGLREIVRCSRALEESAAIADWEQAANQIEQIARSLNYVQNLLQAP